MRRTLAACLFHVHPATLAAGPTAATALGCAAAFRGFARGDRAMHWITWIILGLIAGFIASKIVNKQGAGILMDIVIGIVGAVVGGFIGDKIGLGGLEGFSLWSILLSVVGAIIVLLLYRAVASRA